MQRSPKPTDFVVDVPGVGAFTFGRRTMADEIKIQVEYARIIEGTEPTAWLQTVGGWLSVFRTLTVRSPDDWDIDGMDPLDEETYAKMAKVFSALKEKEDSFRRRSNVSSEGSGAPAV